MWIYPLIVQRTLWMPHSQFVRYSLIIKLSFYIVASMNLQTRNRHDTHLLWLLVLLKQLFIFPLINTCHLTKAEPWLLLFLHDAKIGTLYTYPALSPPVVRIIIHINNSSMLLLLWNYKKEIGVLAPFALNIISTQAT